MDNLHRELSPVSDAAWGQIEDEAARTFKRHIAGRRLVDVREPAGPTLAAVGTGHSRSLDAPHTGVVARIRESAPVVELRVPFRLDRTAIDDVEHGAQDSDWQPVKDAARQLAFAEDRAVFEGYAAAGITGLRRSSSNPALELPADVRDYPDVISRALSLLRVAGVGGPYSVALSADAYTAVNETTDHGYPILDHISRLISGDIVWAPAIEGAFVLTTRGDDFDLRLGQDVEIGYLSHDDSTVELYLQESLTFLTNTAEAVVALQTR